MNIVAVGSSAAGIITASASVLTAIALVVTALTIFIPMLRTTKDTHKIVNQQRTDMQSYNRALVRALKDAGIDVPVDQATEGAENAI